MTIAQRLAVWSHGLAWEDLPNALRHAALRCLIDTLGVILAGREAQPTMAAASLPHGPGKAWSVAQGNQAIAPAGAALINGTAGHAWDFDDTSYTGVMHGTVVVLPAALAAAQDQDRSGGALLTALIAGLEVDYNVALLATTHHYMKGWWSSGTFGVFGAAAAAAKLLDLNAEATRHALALAGCQAMGLRAALGSDAKPLLAGRAAAIGLEAAYWAQAGMTGPEDVFESKQGFIAVMNDSRSDPSVLNKLGQRWTLLDPGIFFKPFPLCSAAHAAAELAGSLCSTGGLSQSDITEVTCRVPPLVRASMIHDDPRSPRQAQFSLPFAIAAMICKGKIEPDQLSEEALADETLRAVMDQVRVVVDPVLAEPVEGKIHPECAALKIQSTSGQSLEGYLGEATGMPGNPLSDEALANKFLRCAQFSGHAEAASRALLERIRSIAEMESLRALMSPSS